MNTLVIILLVLAIISVAIMYVSIKNAQEVDDTPISPKFQPRKVIDLSKGTVGTDPVEKPKRRYKRRNKKKKPVVEQTLTTEKRPVGRPKKSE
jgi:hypothetical protein